LARHWYQEPNRCAHSGAIFFPVDVTFSGAVFDAFADPVGLSSANSGALGKADTSADDLLGANARTNCGAYPRPYSSAHS
jgi:hypothetical protein